MSTGRPSDVSSSAESALVEQVLTELKDARKGRGLAEIGRNRIVGPRLAQLCKIDDTDSKETALAKLTQGLSSLMTNLTSSESESVAAALGIGSEFNTGGLLGERIRTLAKKLRIDDRTARRRIDEALALVASHAAKQYTPSGRASSFMRGWHARRIRAVVLLGHNGVEVLEFRTVVSDSADLKSINLGFSTPPRDESSKPPQSLLEIDALYGGDLVERRIETSVRTGFSLDFPRPLKLGEVYEYGIRFRFPPEADLLPYYVCVPFVACEEFDLRVKFEIPPGKVELLSGVLQADAKDSVLHAPAIEIDTLGEVRAIFKELQPGMAYGVRWLPG